MPLELKSNSKLWYGRTTANGKRVLISLGVPVQGRRPKSLREEGDPPFERSRAIAQAKLDPIERELRERGNEELLVDRLLWLKRGVKYEKILLSALYDTWVALSPGKIRSARYLDQIKSLCTKFATFAAQEDPPAKEMVQVSPRLAADFIRTLESSGVTAKTRNERWKTLRTIFKDLADKSGVSKNPFSAVKKLENNDTVFREALTIPQTNAVVSAAKCDSFVYPLVVLALSTALRRCDCCLLTHERINWASRLVVIKPAKHGKPVSIPINDLLEEVLTPIFSEGTPHKRDDYVFPTQAAMFLSNPDGISLRVRKVFERAGFLADADPTNTQQALSVKRVRGKRRASVMGFHSLRTSWITRALLSGVPIEMVKKVTGHHSTEIIQNHYFKPGVAELRATIEDKMPSLMAEPKQITHVVSVSMDPAGFRALLTSITASNYQEVRNQILAAICPNERDTAGKPIAAITVPSHRVTLP